MHESVFLVICARPRRYWDAAIAIGGRRDHLIYIFIVPRTWWCCVHEQQPRYGPARGNNVSTVPSSLPPHLNISFQPLNDTMTTTTYGGRVPSGKFFFFLVGDHKFYWFITYAGYIIRTALIFWKKKTIASTFVVVGAIEYFLYDSNYRGADDQHTPGPSFITWRHWAYLEWRL